MYITYIFLCIYAEKSWIGKKNIKSMWYFIKYTQITYHLKNVFEKPEISASVVLSDVLIFWKIWAWMFLEKVFLFTKMSVTGGPKKVSSLSQVARDLRIYA